MIKVRQNLDKIQIFLDEIQMKFRFVLDRIQKKFRPGRQHSGHSALLWYTMSWVEPCLFHKACYMPLHGYLMKPRVLEQNLDKNVDKLRQKFRQIQRSVIIFRHYLDIIQMKFSCSLDEKLGGNLDNIQTKFR